MEDIGDIEIRLLLEGIYQRYGFDFRDYAFPSIQRRVLHRMRLENLTTISALQERVLRDITLMEKLLTDFSINVTEMFRDPEFFLSFRHQVIPILRELPSIRIWHAGCSTGEEVISMAILLHEEGLYEKTKIYATDMNELVFKTAKNGCFPLIKMKDYTKNYIAAGGTEAFSDYYKVESGQVFFSPFLLRNITYGQHNLATDGSFNEFHVIICRNVLIYFNRHLQDRVHKLFYQSLNSTGILGLGNKEAIKFNCISESYTEIDHSQRIYQKINRVPGGVWYEQNYR